jgi:hypothetical protein
MKTKDFIFLDGFTVKTNHAFHLVDKNVLLRKFKSAEFSTVFAEKQTATV